MYVRVEEEVGGREIWDVISKSINQSINQHFKESILCLSGKLLPRKV